MRSPSTPMPQANPCSTVAAPAKARPLPQSSPTSSKPLAISPTPPESGKLVDIEETSTAYYVRFDVTDRPGVVAEIAAVLAKHTIGISGTHSPVDPSNPDAEFVDMVFLLHSCPFGKLTKALTEIETLNCINSKPVVFRIENLG